MPVIAITCGLHTEPEQLIKDLAHSFNAPAYSDADLVAAAGRIQGLDTDLILRVVHGKPITYNNFTHDRERCMSGLKKALFNTLSEGNCILTGIISHLIPSSLPHIFRVLSTAPASIRKKRAIESGKFSEQSADAVIERADRRAARWIMATTGRQPMDTALYDLVIPDEGAYTRNTNMSESQLRALSGRIQDSTAQPPFNRPDKKKTEDFGMSAEVEIALATIGKGLLVDTTNGKVTVTLDRKVMNLSKMQQDIMAAANAVPGVRSVKTKIGPNYYKGSIIRNFDTGPPPNYRTRT